MKNALDYISIKGFRSIREIEQLPLRPINVLIGPNGSGKSNFIGVFDLLRALRRGRLVEYTDKSGGADKILSFGSKETPTMEFEVSFENGINGYRIELSPTDDDRFYIDDEMCWYWDKESYDSPYIENILPGRNEAGISREQNRTAEWVRAFLLSWRKYHFHNTSDSSPTKKTGDVDDNRLFRSNGANLAAYLMLLQEEHPSEYQLIRKTVQQVTPFFDDFQLAPLRRNPNKVKLEWTHKSSDAYFDAAALSDGTLRFMCLATLFLQPVAYRPSVILIDEPELGLHPYAVTLLASMIKSAAKRTQVILSTQSALLLDHFEPNDVLVAGLEQGATSLHRLDRENLEEWLEDYSLGQLWEKNAFGGRPTRG